MDVQINHFLKNCRKDKLTRKSKKSNKQRGVIITQGDLAYNDK